MKVPRALATLTLIALPTLSIRAGTEIQIEQRDLASAEPATTISIQIGDQALRLQQKGTDGEEILFRSPEETVWIINHRKKQIHKLTKADLDQLATQVAGAFQQVQQQLAALSPEQRAAFEQMMQGQLPQGLGLGGTTEAPPPGRWEKVAAGETVGPWSCDHFRYRRGDTIQREVWVTPLSAVQVDANTWKTMAKMGEFFKGFAEKMPLVLPKDQLDPASWDMPPELATSHFPVKWVEFENGQPASQTTFVSIKSTSFPPDNFAPPADYQVVPLAMGDDS